MTMTEIPTILREALDKVAAEPQDPQPETYDEANEEPIAGIESGDVEISVTDEPEGVQAELMPGMGIDYERLVATYARRSEDLKAAKERRQEANEAVTELTKSLKDLKETVGPWLLRQENQELDVEIPHSVGDGGEIRYKRLRVSAGTRDEIELVVGLRSMEVTCPHGVTYWQGEDVPCDQCQEDAGVIDLGAARNEREQMEAEAQEAAALEESMRAAEEAAATAPFDRGPAGEEGIITEIEQEPQH